MSKFIRTYLIACWIVWEQFLRMKSNRYCLPPLASLLRVLCFFSSLAPFGITKSYTDGWGAYERHLNAEQHQVGKENTQKIESKHINLRASSAARCAFPRRSTCTIS